MQESVEKAYNRFFFYAPMVEKSASKVKNTKIMKYILHSCNYTDFFYSIVNLCVIV